MSIIMKQVVWNNKKKKGWIRFGNVLLYKQGPFCHEWCEYKTLSLHSYSCQFKHTVLQNKWCTQKFDRLFKLLVWLKHRKSREDIFMSVKALLYKFYCILQYSASLATTFINFYYCNGNTWVYSCIY